MKKLMEYGEGPFGVAVVHGGPGAGGEMAAVARELAVDVDVLEPIQTALSLDGQVEELKTVLEKNANLPVTLIGFSWGAWLSYIVAGRYPAIVKKLILVGCGPFEEKYAVGIEKTRLGRLTKEERIEFASAVKVLGGAGSEKDAAFVRLGALASKADAYDAEMEKVPRGHGPPYRVDCQANIFLSVWPEAAELRRSGKLLELGKHIKCPVVAIHGDYDPHPAEGVEQPLGKVLESFQFVLLEKCGHKPWVERYAREEFFQILKKEL